MKITGIQTYHLHAPLEKPFGWSQGWTKARDSALVRVLTDEGLESWGEAGRGREREQCCHYLQGVFAPLIMGQDPLDRVAVWEKLYGLLARNNLAWGIPMQALSGLDIALWDLAGKAAHLPVRQLLGGCLRDKVAVYATGLYYLESDDPLNALVEEAVGYAEQGFLGMKMKIGLLSPPEDLQRVGAVREAIGPQLKLMVDANQAYNASTAISLGQELEKQDILWLEEPVPAYDLEGYLRVKGALNLAIAGGECLYSRFGFREFLARRALDIAQPDLCDVGGLTEGMRVAAMAIAYGIQVCPHVWGSSLATAASLHFTACLPPVPSCLSPSPFYQEPVMELDRTPHPFRDEIIAAPFQPVGGYLEVPKGPGLGVEVDLKAVERHVVKG